MLQYSVVQHLLLNAEQRLPSESVAGQRRTLGTKAQHDHSEFCLADEPVGIAVEYLASSVSIEDLLRTSRTILRVKAGNLECNVGRNLYQTCKLRRIVTTRRCIQKIPGNPRLYGTISLGLNLILVG